MPCRQLRRYRRGHIAGAPEFTSTGCTLSLPISLDSRRSSFALIPAYLVPLHVPAGGNAEKLFCVSAEFTRRFW